MRVTVVNEWRQAWKWLSVHMASLAVGFGLLPEDKQAAVLAFLHIPQSYVAAVLGLIFIVTRLINQTPKG